MCKSISISVSSDTGGFTENINAGLGDAIFGSTEIAAESMSNSIKGSGSFKTSHWISNKAGAHAGTGVDIRKAESYLYDYYLSRGSEVSAGETLDVLNANYINAYASAFNAQGNAASVNTVVSDPGKKACLTGYSNWASASRQEVAAFQTAEGASAPNGYILTKAESKLNKIGFFPLELRLEKADASSTVKEGFIAGYTDQAASSNYGLEATQHMDNATGKQIDTGSKSTFYFASLFSGLKRSAAETSTKAVGTLTGYDGTARKSMDLVEALQSGHIEGTFSSTANAGAASKTRTSNYGTVYDFNMQAKIEVGLPGVSGRIGYYVDDDNPSANKIQGAVDAAESGDVINVLPGTYFEHAAIDKSLDILGAGADQTVVDGQMTGGYIFGIGSANSDIDVTLSGMAIINAGGINNKGRSIIKDCLVHGNAFYGDGAGIRNSGTITVIGCDISRNTAIYEGGGIYNEGTATIIHSDISENKAGRGGGIANRGTITVFNSNISDNSAWQGGGIFNFNTANISNSNILRNIANGGYGGGIHSSGIARIEGSDISGNSASYGGGINNWGEVTLKDSTISINLAVSGGGIYTEPGSAKIVNSTVSRNLAYVDGGGIYNSWYFSVADILENSTINQNIADSDNDGVGTGGGIYWSGSTLNFIDANGDGIVDPNTIVFDNHLGNGDVNNIVPPIVLP